MKYTAEGYLTYPHPYEGLPPPDYPFHDRTIQITSCGRICIGKMKINLSKVFAGQSMGLREVHDGTWLVSFMDYDLGYFDDESQKFEPLPNPFGPRILYPKGIEKQASEAEPS